MDAAIRRKSLGLTILIHGLILLALLFFVISTRIPPFEEGTLAGGGGGGTIVDFGELAVALDASANNPKQTTPAAEQSPTEQEEDIMTSETEETTPVPLHNNKTVKKVKDNKSVKKPKSRAKEVTEVKQQIRVPVVDPRNVYPKINSQGTSTTANAGDQGQPNGQKGGSMFPGMNGIGNGSGGGEGSGNGPGIGPGSGPFKGITWGAGGGRNILSAPQFRSKTNEPGKVTLKIFVDENGNVTRVERSETQTLNPVQVAEAIDYVKKVKFSKGSGISIAYPIIEFSAK